MAMVFLGAVVFGLKSYQQLPLNLMPDLSYPTLTVRTEYPEAAPEEVENFVSRPLEEALGTVSDLVEIRSVSSAGLSEVMLEFTWGTDMDFASLDVREKMDRVQMPEEVERPMILQYNPALDPILRVGLYGDLDLAGLRRIAEKEWKREIEGLPGVASVKIKGGFEEEVLVEIDEARLAQTGLTMSQVAQRLAQENINLAGGSLREGGTQYLVRTLNEFADPEEIAAIVVGRRGGQEKGARAAPSVASEVPPGLAGRSGGLGQGDAEIRLRDVATVRWARKKQQVITRINGLESVELEVYKEADSNTVRVAGAVKKALGLEKADRGPAKGEPGKPDFRARMEREYPGIRTEVISDPARFIASAIGEVRSTAVQGGVLAFLILLLFLRDWKSTLIIGVSIPVSVVATFIPMMIFGVSLNLMSLGGLALGVGMLVDNSIVVLESIFRCREEGDPAVQAANRGVGEVGAAILASTLTTISVFFPIVFVKGIAGQLFRDLALTVSFSLLASLLVAFYLVPMLASRQVRLPRFGEGRADEEPQTLATVFARWTAGAKVWLLRNARPYRWLAEARGYLTGKVPEGVGEVGPSDSLTRARCPGIAMGLALRFYGFCHPFLEAIRFLALGILGGLVLIAGTAVLGLARLLVPAMGAAKAVLVAVFRPLLVLFEKGFRSVSSAYPGLLRQALRRRGPVVALCLILLAHCLYLIPGLGTELIPRIRQGQFNLKVEKPVGTPVEETARSVEPVEKAILGDPRAGTVFAEIGSEASGQQEAEKERAGENTAVLTVVLRQGRKDLREEDALMESLRQRLRDFADAQFEFELPSLFSFKTPVEVEIEGNDLEELRRIASQVEALMHEVPGIADVRSSARPGNPEMQVLFDRDRLARFGLEVSGVAALVQAKVLGNVPTKLSRGEDRYDIRVRADRNWMRTLEDLQNLRIDLPGGSSVPLSSLAEMRVRPGPSEVRRVGQRRVAVVTANLVGTDLGAVSREILEKVRSVDLPPGYGISLAGQNREMQTSFESLWFALLLSVFLVYIVMASQFESLLHPLVILFSIPLGLIGVVYVLSGLGIPLSVVVFIGVILLGGIMVNNAIVLIDYVNTLRRRGMARTEALLLAGKIRLRPILMTTGTTVLGLLPMALGLGEGAEIRMPMAVVVIAGLTCSTVLTLVVIPVVYSLLDRGK